MIGPLIRRAIRRSGHRSCQRSWRPDPGRSPAGPECAGTGSANSTTVAARAPGPVGRHDCSRSPDRPCPRCAGPGGVRGHPGRGPTGRGPGRHRRRARPVRPRLRPGRWNPVRRRVAVRFDRLGPPPGHRAGDRGGRPPCPQRAVRAGRPDREATGDRPRGGHRDRGRPGLQPAPPGLHHDRQLGPELDRIRASGRSSWASSWGPASARSWASCSASSGAAGSAARSAPWSAWPSCSWSSAPCSRLITART